MDISPQHGGMNGNNSEPRSFNPCFNGYFSSTKKEAAEVIVEISFNPCFNGYFSSTRLTRTLMAYKLCFNPCFNGYFSSTKMLAEIAKNLDLFQSLF